MPKPATINSRSYVRHDEEWVQPYCCWKYLNFFCFAFQSTSLCLVENRWCHVKFGLSIIFTGIMESSQGQPGNFHTNRWSSQVHLGTIKLLDCRYTSSFTILSNVHLAIYIILMYWCFAIVGTTIGLDSGGRSSHGNSSHRCIYMYCSSVWYPVRFNDNDRVFTSARFWAANISFTCNHQWLLV